MQMMFINSTSVLKPVAKRYCPHDADDTDDGDNEEDGDDDH